MQPVFFQTACFEVCPALPAFSYCNLLFFNGMFRSMSCPSSIQVMACFEVCPALPVFTSLAALPDYILLPPKRNSLDIKHLLLPPKRNRLDIKPLLLPPKQNSLDIKHLLLPPNRNSLDIKHLLLPPKRNSLDIKHLLLPPTRNSLDIKHLKRRCSHGWQAIHCGNDQTVLDTVFSSCATHYSFLGLARTVYTHCTWPYVWWFPAKNTVCTPYIGLAQYRMYTVCVYTYKYMVLAHIIHSISWYHQSLLTNLSSSFSASCAIVLAETSLQAEECRLNCSWDPCVIRRVGQNHTLIGIYGIHTIFLTGKSPYIPSYTACIYGDGQP